MRKGPIRGPKPQVRKGSLKRLIKELFNAYPKMLALVAVCIVVTSVTSALPSVFQSNIISICNKEL